MEHPQILTLNLKSDIVEYLKAKSYSVYEGSLGKIVKLNTHYNHYSRCLLQHDYPGNFHEYDIVIIDLTNNESVNYDEGDHKRVYNKTATDDFFKCEYPQNIFDPRACSLSFLQEKISDNLSGNFLLIVFCAEDEEIVYNYISSNYEKDYTYNLYSFSDRYVPNHVNKHGMQTKIADDDNELCQLLKKFNSGMTYDLIFSHPFVYKENKHVKDPDFRPLVLNKNGEIVSFCKFITANSGMFFFPQLKEKKEFLAEFLEEVAPSIFPAIFPKNVKNSWIWHQQYTLPNQEKLVNEKQAIYDDYKKKLEEKDDEIAENFEKYAFLHDLLTKTDAELVKAVIKYFEWLGFTDVKDGDATNDNIVKEEDIQIETGSGLLIFEIKGLGATSKDSDCNQIGKIKFRRSKQRGAFDVYGNYIVNHQRHLPPLDRKNPPFTPQQIEDAKNEERGLLTTWQLFNLYFNVENGVFTKEQIRDAFYSYGFIDFIPKPYLKIGVPEKLYKGGSVIIIAVPADIELNVKDELLISGKDGFQRLIIQSIKIDDAFVNSATNVEAGIQINGTITKSDVIYKVTGN